MNEPSESEATRALALLREGKTQEALRTLESSESTDRSEAGLLARATAYATLGRIHDAEQDAKRALAMAAREQRAPGIATLAIAARIAEDAQDFQLAFERYVKLLEQPSSHYSFWRGLWRVALASRDASLRERALQITLQSKTDVTHDPLLCVTVARTWREHLRTRDDLLMLLQMLDRALSLHPTETKLATFRSSLVVDAGPTFGSENSNVLAPPYEEKLNEGELADVRLAYIDYADTWLRIPELFASESAILQWRERYANGVQRLAALANAKRIDAETLRRTPFRLAYMARGDLELQSARGDLLAELVLPLTPKQAAKISSKKLRVGFISKHLRDCTVGQYFRRLVSEMKSDEIEVFSYACGTFDAFTDAIERSVSASQRFPLVNDEDNQNATLVKIATAIAGDALDVLVYPEVGMEPLIEKLAAMRLAPLQCALWGHPDTTGLPTIDVFFSAESMEPANAQSHYRERLQLLPGLGCAYPRPPAPAALDRVALGLPINVPLAVCAQSSFKWRPKFVEMLAQILVANPSAKLIYFRSRDAVAAIGFEAYVDAILRRANLDIRKRCIELPETTREAFLATLAACDLALDTFDFSGGNTTLDSLSVGLPVVTLPGEFMRGRQSMAMLQLIDANELIAANEADYVRIANELLFDPAKRQRISAQLRAKAEKLFDDPTPVAAFREWLLQQKLS